MSDLFKNMNLARFIIMMTVPLAIGLAVFESGQAERVASIQAGLDGPVYTLLSQIQQLGDDHTRLTNELNGEGLKGDAAPQTYIRSIATSNRVEIGDVKISESKRTPFTGIEDRIYTIRPFDSERGFQRLKVSNFLYRLEEDSSRIKVTDISIDIAQRRIKNHIVPDDEWTFTAQVTSRQAK